MGAWNKTWALCQSNKALNDWAISPAFKLYYSKETFLSLNWIIGLMKQLTEKRDFFRNAMLEEEKDTIQRRNLFSYQTTLQDETETQIMMGQWWVVSHLDKDYIDVHIHGPLFKLGFHFRTQRLTGIRVLQDLFASLPNVATFNKSFSAFYI